MTKVSASFSNSKQNTNQIFPDQSANHKKILKLFSNKKK